MAAVGAASRASRCDWRVAAEVVNYGRVEWAISSFAPYKSSGMDSIFPARCKRDEVLFFLQTSKQLVKFSFFLSCSEHVLNPVF